MINTFDSIDYINDLVEQFELGFISLDEMWNKLDEFLDSINSYDLYY